jgi:competence protein ComEA
MPIEPESMTHLKSQIDLNRASEEQLASVPAIGPDRARKIVAYRQQHGAFESLADLKKIPDLEERFVDELRAALSVEGRRL